jgi:hypothetical protein
MSSPVFNAACLWCCSLARKAVSLREPGLAAFIAPTRGRLVNHLYLPGFHACRVNQSSAAAHLLPEKETPCSHPPIHPWAGHLPGASSKMNPTAFEEEADRCRRRALEYLSRPEAPFLLRVAREFDRLQRTRASTVSSQQSPD